MSSDTSRDLMELLWLLMPMPPPYPPLPRFLFYQQEPPIPIDFERRKPPAEKKQRPQISTYNVVRDDKGRIVSIEIIENLTSNEE